MASHQLNGSLRLPAELQPTTLSPVTQHTSNVTSANVTITTTEFDGMIDNWSKVFRYHGTTLVVLIGCISNGLAFLVVASSKMRYQSTGWYILALAIVDTLVLIMERIASLIDPRLDYIVPGSDATCQCVLYLKYATKLLSAFLIVALNIERFAVVAFPFQGHRIARKRIAFINIVIFTLISFSSTAYSLDSLMFVDKYGCVIPTAKANLYLYGSLIVDIGIGEILTSLLVILLATGTSVALCRARRSRGGSVMDIQRCAQSKRDRQVTIMLLIVSAAFILLRLPHTIFWIPRFIRTHDDNFPHDFFRQAIDVTYVIALVNYAINFYLYCLTGRAFRKDFVALARKVSGKSTENSLQNVLIQPRVSSTPIVKFNIERKGSLPTPVVIPELARLHAPTCTTASL